jgi:hypothetical protein
LAFSIGRRGGKSRAISVLATYIAGLCKHENLVPGERGVLLVIAPDQKQADVVLSYTEAAFRDSPILNQLVETRTARALKLTNRIDIEVRAADYRTVRRPTFITVIGDEVAFFMIENSVSPDSEILNAVRPGLATTGGPLFLISSPYARRGELWKIYSKHFGAKGDPSILVAQAPSRVMNPSLPSSVVDRALERDAASAAAEYMAEFRRDIESFVTVEAATACVSPGVYERAPLRSFGYAAFVDPSGGSSDSMSLAIGHFEINSELVVIDAIREAMPPFSPEQVVSEFSQLLKSYSIFSVTGDRYAGEWPREQFSRFGISYEPAAKPKSELYLDALALLNSRQLDLLDHPRTFSQLIALERRSVCGGRDTIDHPPNQHDDLINAVAGVASNLIARASYNLDAMADPNYGDPTPVEVYRNGRRVPPTMTPEMFERISRPIGLPRLY